MPIEIEALNAKHGDCLIVHYGAADDRHLVLIDGGPRGVYRSHLSKRLAQLKQANGGAPVRFDLGMVSHIDADHIQGIVELTDELIKSDDDLCDFDWFWHNAFDDLAGTDQVAGTAALASLASDTVQMSEAAFAAKYGLKDPDSRLVAIIAGVEQGRTLRDNLRRLGLEDNPPFPNGLVIAPQRIELFDGLFLTVIGPPKDRLEELQEKWDKEASPAALAAFLDKSVANLSSIVVLIEYEGRKILLTGDARGDDILDGLKAAGHLNNVNTGTLELDVFKVPHHGSERNVTQKFFARLPARHYVFSADGKNSNPDVKTIRMVAQARKGEAFTMHFTNRVPHVDDEISRLKAGAEHVFEVRIRKPAEHSISVTV